jgi:branched-chain amino acid aminotransferase
VISPVGELSWKEEKVTINRGEIGALSQRLYDYLYGVQTGAVEDAYGWTLEVK